MRFRFLCALIGLSLVASSGSFASAAPLAPPVECWIENQTPSVPVGGWARYVVHATGGYGTYGLAFSFGDGTHENGTYSTGEIPLGHVFWSTGTFLQTATVSGAGSSYICTTQTEVY